MHLVLKVCQIECYFLCSNFDILSAKTDWVWRNMDQSPCHKMMLLLQDFFCCKISFFSEKQASNFENKYHDRLEKNFNINLFICTKIWLKALTRRLCWIISFRFLQTGLKLNFLIRNTNWHLEIVKHIILLHLSQTFNQRILIRYWIQRRRQKLKQSFNRWEYLKIYKIKYLQFFGSYL